MDLTTIPWPHSPEEQAAVGRALRFRYHKWDLHTSGRLGVLPEAISLSPSLHARLAAAAETFASVLARLEERVARSPELLARLDIPPELHPLIASEPTSELQLARYDFHPTPDGRWMVSEFNEDVPGGFNETVGLADLLATSFPGHAFTGDLRAAVTAALAPWRHVALVYATGYSEDLQHMVILDDWLTEAGHRTVRCSPAHLRRGLRGVRAAGHRVDAAVRYYPGEWFPRLPNFGTWRRVASRLPMLNPIRRLIRQSKLLFSLWREGDLLTPEERGFVREHAPWTAHFEPSEHLAMLRDDRSRWVLKQAFGRMGDAVVIGALVTEAEWEATLAEVLREPHRWLVQARFEHAPQLFGAGPLYPAVGVYLVNGRFAGYYSRAATTPHLTHEAYHVATLVEALRAHRSDPHQDVTGDERAPGGESGRT